MKRLFHKKWFHQTNFIAMSLLASSLCYSSLSTADDFNASFKGTDIQEFINIVGRNLNKTVIIDPSVKGSIDVRSYDSLNEEQYWRFFLNVLDVYGYSVVETTDGIIKVIKSKNAKTSAIPVVSNDNTMGDGVITRVVTVHNVSVRELSPLLRQLIDNAGAGNVVNYDPANIILLTGQADVVNRLAEIIKRVDQVGNKEIEIVVLEHSSSSEMVRIIDALNKTTGPQRTTPEILEPKLVADERTNSILISGDPKTRARLKKLIEQLDIEMASKGNNQVIYLKYAKAEELVSVLQGISNSLQAEKDRAGSSGKAGGNKVVISAHKETNALVLTASTDIMQALKDVIAQLDIRRAQVLIEALIVEMAEGDGINLGVQWGSLNTGAVVQHSNTGASISQVLIGLEEAKDYTQRTPIVDSNTGAILSYQEQMVKGDYSTLASALGAVNGAALSVIMGDWTALLSAVATDSNSNILSSPSITVMDNGEASFIVGEEVPIITGSSAGANNDNPFQTVDRKEVGIKLKVVPQINEGDSVQLNIEQEVSNVLGANGTVDVRFAKRQLNTSVMIKDGEMLVLGGLMDERAVESESKIPLLGDIPFLGYLFRSTSSQVEKRNLMVFIKPTIIRDGMTSDGITQRKYNYIRAEQLYKVDEGLKLLPDSKIPLIAPYGSDAKLAPELQIFIDQLSLNSNVLQKTIE